MKKRIRVEDSESQQKITFFIPNQDNIQSNVYKKGNTVKNDELLKRKGDRG